MKNIENIEGSQKKRAKHLKDNKKSLLIIIIGIGVIILIATIFFVLLWLYQYKQQQLIVEPTIDLQTQDDTIMVGLPNPSEQEFNDEFVDVTDMPHEIHGYPVEGIIVIDKVNIKSYILSETSDDSLKYAVTKFYGPDINTPGNYCITGHNYRNVFGPIYNLKPGDTFYLIGKDGRRVTYEVTERLPSVEANDMSHIEQNTDNKRKVTLITCTLSGLTRYLVKAEEKI